MTAECISSLRGASTSTYAQEVCVYSSRTQQHDTRSLHSTLTTPSPSLACCPIGPKPVKALHSNDGANSIFGEMSLLDPIGKANATVSVPPHAYCDSFILPAESFRSIISTFPSFQKRVEWIKREIPKWFDVKIRAQCLNWVPNWGPNHKLGPKIEALPCNWGLAL